jgi:uncharacterized protein (DUF2235 family)
MIEREDYDTRGSESLGRGRLTAVTDPPLDTAARAEETRTMRKRLVVFCDGTWNSADKPAATNVCKLWKAVDEAKDAAVPQIVKYEPGVGTRRWERISGGAFGVGLSRNVRECYEFLVDNYEPGDELFLFGFSRGAFTARSLGGLVRNSGILRPEHRGMVKDAYQLYRSRKPEDAPSEAAALAFRGRYSHPDADITFVGVWDTVGALGIPTYRFRLPGLSKRWTFHDTTLSKAVHNAFHAISIDERRKPFVPTLWVKKVDEHGNVVEPPEHQTVEQMWFAGVHSDVGGGYREADLSDIPLRWLVDRARECGLVLKPVELGGEGNASAPLHNSLSFFYRLLGPVDRRLVAIDGEPINASLSPSVKARRAAEPSYDPPGLAEWLAREAVPR